MFPLRLDLSLVTSVKLKNISNLKVVSSDDKCIMLFDRDVVSFCFSYEDDNAVKNLSYWMHLPYLLNFFVDAHLWHTHIQRGRGENQLAGKPICQMSNLLKIKSFPLTLSNIISNHDAWLPVAIPLGKIFAFKAFIWL